MTTSCTWIMASASTEDSSFSRSPASRVNSSTWNTKPKTDGSLDLRRRRLRQDRSCDARGFSRRRRRKAGGRAGADDDLGAATSADLSPSLSQLPGARRNDQPVFDDERDRANTAG